MVVHLASFWKSEARGQAMLPDMSVLIEQKLVKMPKFKCDILSSFQTLWLCTILQYIKMRPFWVFFNPLCNVFYFCFSCRRWGNRWTKFCLDLATQAKSYHTFLLLPLLPNCHKTALYQTTEKKSLVYHFLLLLSSDNFSLLFLYKESKKVWT